MDRVVVAQFPGSLLPCLVAVIVLGGANVASRTSAADETRSSKPATVAEAVRAIDLTSFPILKEAKEPVYRSVARLSYSAASDCKTAFEFQRRAFAALKWTEHPGSAVTDQYASGTFSREGFVASLSAMPSSDPKQPGMVTVSLSLHGNVALQKLPVPSHLKSLYAGPQLAMYSTDTPVAQTVEECRKLLLAQGWQPYGQVEGTLWFKQNAVRLTASIASAPAQGGKTSVSFSTEQLSADVPAPAETVQLQYADTTKQILFDTKDSEDNIVAFYRRILGSEGWKSTTEHTNKIGFKNVLIFRNPAKDMFTLETYPVKAEQVLRVTLQHHTAAEVAAIEKRLDEQVAAAKLKLDREKSTPLPKVQIALPAGAKLTEEAKTRLEFTVATGQAQVAAESLRKALRDAGWKEEVTVAERMIGEIDFKKGNQGISVSYVDPGFIPAEFTIQGTRVELERVVRKE